MARSTHTIFEIKNARLSGLHVYKTAVLMSCSLILGIPACSTLPKQPPQPIEYAFDTPTEQSSLAKIVLPLREQYPNLTGYHVLYDPLEALAARIHLINKAEKTLDLQYYIWDNDKIGSLALYSIIQAADRGVKVRLLMDDNNAKKNGRNLFSARSTSKY